MLAITPRPAMAFMSLAAGTSIDSAIAASTTARASGCSLPRCTPAARRMSCLRSSLAAMASVSVGRPTVNVPVLSNATTLIRWAISSATASLIKIPCRAAAPVPTIIAVGVARPSAHGHAITRTATAFSSPICQSPVAQPQPSNVINATANTTGTNRALTRSTSRWIGAFSAWADSTNRTMRDNVLSLPTLPVFTSSKPSPLTAPPVTCSPTRLATGKLSPVISDSST